MYRKIITSLLVVLLSVTAAFSQSFDEASNYYNQGNAAMQKGNFDEAITLYYKSAEMFKSMKNTSNSLTAQHALASAYMAKNDLSNAQNTIASAIAAAQQLDPPNEDLTAELYNIQAQIYSNQRKTKEALVYFEKSYDIYKQKYGEESVKTANAIRNIASLSAMMGNTDTALICYTKAKEIYLKAEGAQSPKLVEIYLSLGQFESANGHLDISDEYYNAALDIIEKGNINSRYLGDIYSGIGANYLIRGEVNNADGYITKAIDIKTKVYGPNAYYLYKDYYYQAIIQYQNHQMEDAMKSYVASGDILAKYYGNKHPELGNIYNAIALIHEANENDAAAIKFFARAQKVFAETYGEKSTEYAQVCNNIGILQLHQNNYTDAAENFQKSIDIIAEGQGFRSSKLIEPYLNLGTIYMNSKQYIKAIRNYQNSIICNMVKYDLNPQDSIFTNPKFGRYQNGIKLIDALKNKARATVQLYDSTKQTALLSNAIECVKVASQIIDETRKTTSSEIDRMSLSAMSKELFESGLYAAFRLSETKPDDITIVADAFYFSEKNKAATLLEAIAQTGATTFSNIPTELTAEEKMLSEKMAYYKKMIAEEDNQKSVTNLKSQLFETTNKYNALISRFEKEYPEYYAARFAAQVPSMLQIQQQIDNWTMLISYFVGVYDIYYITVEKNKCQINKFQYNSKQYTRMATDYIKSLTTYSSQTIANYKKMAYQMYTDLFPQNIPKTITKITIVPDGFLNAIPFETLFTKEEKSSSTAFQNMPFLIKKYQMNYNYSSYLVMQLIQQSFFADNIKWMGIAPAFDAENECYFKGSKIAAIPQTIEEVKSISNKITDKGMEADYLLRKEASETAIKNADLKQYNIIHVATHGTVDSEHPELSGLLLSSGEGSKDDGMLYNGEIYNLRLNANLVVLSACETGLGKISEGEGVIGLGRSLIYAGAKNIVCSLWQVSDASTENLMINFYNNLLSTPKEIQLSYSEKLRAAKLKMISEEKFAHPYYWSPFIIIGK